MICWNCEHHWLIDIRSLAGCSACPRYHRLWALQSRPCMAPLRGPQPRMPQSNKPTSTSFCSWPRLAKDWLSPTKKTTSISAHVLHLINRIHVLTFEGFGPKYWDTEIVDDPAIWARNVSPEEGLGSFHQDGCRWPNWTKGGIFQRNENGSNLIYG